MSLRQIADRFAEDEGNYFSLYEQCFPIVVRFFQKLEELMVAEHYKFKGGSPGELPIDPSNLDRRHLNIMILAVKYMIMNGNCDIDCINQDAWKHYRNIFTSNQLIYLYR